MLTYLLQKPMKYCSHEFQNFGVDGVIRACIALVAIRARHEPWQQPLDGSHFLMKVQTKSRLRVEDYTFRPAELESYSLYFFMAACTVTEATSSGNQLRKLLGKTELNP